MFHTLNPVLSQFIYTFEKYIRQMDRCVVLQKEAYIKGWATDNTAIITGSNSGGVLMWYDKIQNIREKIKVVVANITSYIGHNDIISYRCQKLDAICIQSAFIVDKYKKLIIY